MTFAAFVSSMSGVISPRPRPIDAEFAVLPVCVVMTSLSLVERAGEVLDDLYEMTGDTPGDDDFHDVIDVLLCSKVMRRSSGEIEAQATT